MAFLPVAALVVNNLPLGFSVAILKSARFWIDHIVGGGLFPPCKVEEAQRAHVAVPIKLTNDPDAQFFVGVVELQFPCMLLVVLVENDPPREWF